MFELEDENPPTIIKVIGVGGGGCNAVKAMADPTLKNVSFYLTNTDFPTSTESPQLLNKIQLGKAVTRGRGAGADPAVGQDAAIETLPVLKEYLLDADMLFVAAGLGGGTGTGAAPVIAEAAKVLGILTVGVVTMPFHFEGKIRSEHAQKGLSELEKSVDSLIIVSNDLLASVSGTLPIGNAFESANMILRNAVRGIIDIIQTPGHINVDFADVKTILSHPGRVIMGAGVAEGESRANDALERAISSPLLEGYALNGAKGVLANVTAGSDVTMNEYHSIVEKIDGLADKKAEIIMGLVVDDRLNGAFKVDVIASGLII